MTVNNVVEVKNMILAGAQGQIKAGIVIDVGGWFGCPINCDAGRDAVEVAAVAGFKPAS